MNKMRNIRKRKTAKVIICLLISGIILSAGMVSLAAQEQPEVSRPESAAIGAPTVEGGDGEPTNEKKPNVQPAAADSGSGVSQSGQPETAAQTLGIATLEDLCKIGNDPVFPLDGAYELSEDIVGNGAAFRPIGSAQEPFTGELRGNGHCISGLTIAGDTAGLFSVLAGRVENLSVTDVSVHGATQAGVLAGQVKGSAAVENVYLSGSVTSGGVAGGLAGTIESAVGISSVQVAATIAGPDGMAGAIAGTCRIPAEAFHAVVWSDAYGAVTPFGQTSPQREGPFTIMTEPRQIDLQVGGKQEIKAPVSAPGLSFLRWENRSGAVALTTEDEPAATVTAIGETEEDSITAVYCNAAGRELRFKVPLSVHADEAASFVKNEGETTDLFSFFPTQLAVAEPVDDVFPTVLNAAAASPGATDTTPPDATLILSHLRHQDLRNEEAYDPWYTQRSYFWDTDTGGTLLEDGIVYRYSRLLAPEEIDYGVVSPASALQCFSVLMSDGESGLATKDFDGAASPYFEYYLSKTPLTEEQLKNVSWLPVKQYDTAYAYNGNSGHWIIYVRVADQAGNVTYLSTNGYTQDNEGPVISDVAYTAENETADGWAKSRTLSFRLEDPALEDGTPGFGLDETKVFIHNTMSSSSTAANLSAYGLECVKDADGVFRVKADILPVNSSFSVSARDIAVNPDFDGDFTGPNIKQNKGLVLDKIDSEAPKAENLAQTPTEWSRTKTITVSVRDIAMKMDWDAMIDEDGNFYSYPFPAADGEIDGSGIDEVFLSEDKNAGANDTDNIALSNALLLNASSPRTVSATVDHNGTYYLIMTDKVGNRAEVPIVVTTIDTKLPVVMGVTHTPSTTDNGYLSETDFTLHVTGITDEKETGVPGSVDELWYGTQNDVSKATRYGAYAANEASCSIPVTPPDGATTYYVWARDAFGNYSAPADTTIYKDTTAPTMGQPYTDPAGWTNKAEITLCVPDIQDAASGVEAVLYADHPIADAADGTAMTLSGSAATAVVSPAADDVYTYYFRAVDRAGNLDEEKQATVSIDRSAPTGSIREGKNVWQGFLDAITFGQYHRESTTFTIDAQEAQADDPGKASGIAEIDYCIRETDPKADTLVETLDQFLESSKDWQWIPYTLLSDVAVPIDPNAKRVIYARIADRAGNTTYISSEGLTFDSTPPQVEEIGTEIKDNMRTVTAKLTDELSGVDSAAVKYAQASDGTGEQKIATYDVQTGVYTFSVPADGSRWYLYASDRAGNAMEPVKIPDPSSGQSDHTGNGTPKTGDTAAPGWIYLSIGIAAAAVIVLAIVVMKKKKREHKVQK